MTVPPVWAFVLGSLAAWRIWKLFSTDDILERPREKLAPEGTKRREFLDCPYCAGFWISFLGALGYYLVSDLPLRDGVVYGFLVAAFAMSAVVVWTEILLDLTVAEKDKAEEEAPPE